ncbi:twin-arginine translocase TatA/TatE family subunit [Brumimicrobium glaciale]|uniref:Twin-arginine translocase TatA/TatE family subunit n=1 Tax=Brumimicrobium glaciale TaxID=200475 RepID=A0A4Q4KHU8_9FLAO|nr:twin-arginine translocase TatA/TatE family subunit [Brumimicrobium glaciale]RYM32772.1 twin-arginine translocase TatA/TatE family subunit [Brumimicrobium glaciale]
MLLFINSIAGSEIVVILLFVLIFFGAKSIPGMARGLGKGIRQIKDASQDIQDEIRRTTTDMKRDLNVNQALHDAKNTLQAPVKDFTNNLKASATGVDKNIKGILNDGGKNSIEKSMEAPIKDFKKDLKETATEIDNNIKGEVKDNPKTTSTESSKDVNSDRKPDQENLS